jgi:hypothetical protein
MVVEALGLFLLLLLTLGAGQAGRVWRRPTTHGGAGWGRPPKRFLGALESGGFVLGTHRGKPVMLPREDALRHGVIAGNGYIPVARNQG